MNTPTEYRLIYDYEYDSKYKDVFNNGEIVVNIKNLTKKEEKFMLENEKNFELEQLNSIKAKYEKNLEELKAFDIETLIENKVAEVKEEIAKVVYGEHNDKISKAEFLIEAINEKIAEVELSEIEIETPVEEVSIETPVEDNPIEV